MIIVWGEELLGREGKEPGHIEDAEPEAATFTGFYPPFPCDMPPGSLWPCTSKMASAGLRRPKDDQTTYRR